MVWLVTKADLDAAIAGLWSRCGTEREFIDAKLELQSLTLQRLLDRVARLEAMVPPTLAGDLREIDGQVKLLAAAMPAKLTESVQRMAESLDGLLFVFNSPGPVRLLVTEQDPMSRFKFELSLPPVTVDDVATRELTVAVGANQPVVFTLQPQDKTSQPLLGGRGDVVRGQLVDVDRGGLRSQPSQFSLEVVDNQAPPLPGQVGLVVLEQLPDEPEPTPEPAPEPTPEPAPEPVVPAPEDASVPSDEDVE